MGIPSLLFIILAGLASSAEAARPLGCIDFLKAVSFKSSESPELSATLSSLSNRYERIYPELNLARMDPKLRKLCTRALVSIDLSAAGRELTPEGVTHLRNLLARFQRNPSLENLSASYIGNLHRGNLEEAARESVVLMAHLQSNEIGQAASVYGLHPVDSPAWKTFKREHPAVFERIKVRDVSGKDHELFVLLGHPDGATSAVQRFHQILKERYGSELYINDDLVPSALGFYQGVPEGDSSGLAYIILRSENLKQDYLDFVGFHEGRHVMFKNARSRLKSVAPVEVQVTAAEGQQLPIWYERDLIVPTPENAALRERHARERNLYKNFMTFEENYTHLKDLQYANRMRFESVGRLYETAETLPPHRLFDLNLVQEKIHILDEITFKTKNTSLEARLHFEKESKEMLAGLSGNPEKIATLEALRTESLSITIPGKYRMKIDFVSPEERAFIGDLLLKYRIFQKSIPSGGEVLAAARANLSASLKHFHELISERLIQAHDFALDVKINLIQLRDRYEVISKKSGITKEEYLDFRRELFNQGRNAKQILFKEGAQGSDASSPEP